MTKIAKFSPIYGNNIGDLMISECIEYMLCERSVEVASYDLLLRRPKSYWTRTTLDKLRIAVSSFLSKRFSFLLSLLKKMLFRARQDANRYRTLSERYDAIIVGGGNVVMDKMGSDYALRVREICVNSACPVGVYAAGVGPLVKDRKRLVNDIKNAASFVSVRDRQSQKMMNLDEVFLNFDPAFIVSDIAPTRRGAGYIGVNVIADFFSSSEFEQFAQDVATFAVSRGAKIRLIVTAYPSDSWETERLSLSILDRSPDVEVETVKIGPEIAELAEAYADVEFFIGCRMHSLIFALSHGIPSVGCEWDPKVRGMFSMFFGDEFQERMLYQPGRGVHDTPYGAIDVSAIAERVKGDVYRQFSCLLDSILAEPRGKGIPVVPVT